MFQKISFILLALMMCAQSGGQDIKITPDMYEYSKNSITGVYVCTPTHVEKGECKDVDKEYYENLAVLSLGYYEIGILEVNNIKTMAFKGPLSPGAAKNLISLLEKYPEIETLILSSQGGSEEEANQIAEYVKAKKMKTWVPAKRMCLSACVSIFLSGSEMTLDGLLGFHTGQYFIKDPYQVRNLEAAQKTIKEAMYENDRFMMKRVKLFIELNINLLLIDAMIEARGDFLIFTNLEELFNFNPSQNYVQSLEFMSQYAKNQEFVNFDFKSYVQLF